MFKPKKKKCKQCGNQFAPYTTTQIVCSINCALEYNSKKETDKRHAEIKKEVKDRDRLSVLIGICKTKAQEYARKRDAELPCISCGTTTSYPHWQGGHLFKSELYSGIKFDERNINKQCVQCNMHLDGNEVNYVIGYINRYGKESFDKLSDDAKSTKNRKWSSVEVLELINYYKLKIKKLNG